jgi:hypothetical protein
MRNLPLPVWRLMFAYALMMASISMMALNHDSSPADIAVNAD